MRIAEPIPLHLGVGEEALLGKKYPLLDKDEAEVGIVFVNEGSGTFKGVLFGYTTLSFTSYRCEEVLVMAGLWLAYRRR